MDRKIASAHLRIGCAPARPLDATLELRIRCWLARVGWMIERRDIPQAAGAATWPPRAGLLLSARARLGEFPPSAGPAPAATMKGVRQPPPEGGEDDGESE